MICSADHPASPCVLGACLVHCHEFPRRLDEVLSIYADLGITGFALPPPLEDLLDGDMVKAMLKEAIKEGAEKAFGPGASQVANCVPGAGALADRIASKLATLLASALTALQLPWQLQMVELLSSDKLFCEEPWKTDGFEQSPCAEEIGCSGAGLLSLPEPGVMEPRVLDREF